MTPINKQIPGFCSFMGNRWWNCESASYRSIPKGIDFSFQASVIDHDSKINLWLPLPNGWNSQMCEEKICCFLGWLPPKIHFERAWRKNQPVPETILHPQQLGGSRKGVSVALGGHLIRAFLRIFTAKCQPTAGPWDDEKIAMMAARVHMDTHILHDLYKHLRSPCAIKEARLSGLARKPILALHTDTFFALHG